MNILFFLTPKALCSYIEAGSTLRQAMERMENSGYTALPVLDKDGSYCGVLTEGDLLWGMKNLNTGEFAVLHLLNSLAKCLVLKYIGYITFGCQEK